MYSNVDEQGRFERDPPRHVHSEPNGDGGAVGQEGRENPKLPST